MLEHELRDALPSLGLGGKNGGGGERVTVRVAVNADSLATWVLPALDALVQRGLREGYGLELVVDDQDFTHDSLRQGAVLGCMSTVAEALQGCRVQALGVMRYVAVASPGFLAAQLPEGLHARGNRQCRPRVRLQNLRTASPGRLRPARIGCGCDRQRAPS